MSKIKLFFTAFIVVIVAWYALGSNSGASADTVHAVTQAANTVDTTQAQHISALGQEGHFTLMGFLRGLLGILTLLVVAWLFSNNRRAINWRLVFMGLLLQIVLAIGVLKVGFVAAFFDIVSKVFIKVIGFAHFGIDFLLAPLGGSSVAPPLVNFAFTVLPTIVFFAALSSLLYYWGILQKVVYAFAWVMKKTMRLSGAESLATAGNIFLGQTEAPLLIKPYLSKMSKSEIMCLMSGGMATIAGGVLASYIQFLGGDDPVQRLLFAKHLLTASVMSAPAAVVAAKILVPETENVDTVMKISKDRIGSNALEALANGTTDGLKLAVNVAAMLLVFTALIYFGNYILGGFIGRYTGINDWVAAHTSYKELSFQFILGYCCAPISWLMGVSSHDSVLVGQLLGEKTILNEFYAYVTLAGMKTQGLFHDQKSMIMATYILCGFANFASIGIQIGGIGALVPEKKWLLSKLGVQALIGGTLASLFTAVIVGMLM